VAPVENHLGRRLVEVDPHEQRSYQHLLEQVRRTGEPITDVLLSRQVDESGVEHHWSASIYPVRDDAGDTIGVGAVVREVTAAVVGLQRSHVAGGPRA
jgi:hypothetical protein